LFFKQAYSIRNGSPRKSHKVLFRKRKPCQLPYTPTHHTIKWITTIFSSAPMKKGTTQAKYLLAHLYFKGRTTKAQHDVLAPLEALVSPKFAFLIK
jgi:hypothetical protein